MQLRFRSFSLAVFVLACASVRAQNVIQDSDFDNALTAWTTAINGSGTVQVNDADGSPSAPSAQLAAAYIGSSFGVDELYQCVPLVGIPPPWEFGARTRAASSSGTCEIVVSANFATGTCAKQGAGLNNYAATRGTAPGVQGSFTQYAGDVSSDPMPGGAASEIMNLFVAVSCGSPGDSITLNVDHTYFGTAGTTPVRLQSFDVN